jgi:hypothetical protein
MEDEDPLPGGRMEVCYLDGGWRTATLMEDEVLLLGWKAATRMKVCNLNGGRGSVTWV